MAALVVEVRELMQQLESKDQLIAQLRQHVERLEKGEVSGQGGSEYQDQWSRDAEGCFSDAMSCHNVVSTHETCI